MSQEMINRITGISYPVAENEKDSLAMEACNIVSSKLSQDPSVHIPAKFLNRKTGGKIQCRIK